MALAHTILNTLADSPHTGYDLWKEFDESVSCFWRATQQQIYRELTKMENRGLVSCEIIPQEGRPAKKVYSLTAEGMEELMAWMEEPSTPTVIREDLLVKVRGGYLVKPEIIIKELEHRQQIHAQQLARYREKEQKFLVDSENLSPANKCRYLTLRRGIRYEQEWIEWCEEALLVFKKN